jgi:type IV pilus assembly protein PilO
MAKSFHDLSPRAQSIVFVLLSIMTAAGGWQMLLSPMQLDLAGRQTHLEKVQADVTAAQAIAARLPIAQREVRDLEVALQQTTAVIPDEKDPQDVLRHLHELASQSLLNLASWTPKPIVSKAQYSEWPIELGFEGGYHDLGVFFDRIASMSRLMSVSDLKIAVRQRTNGRGSISASCIATTFVFKKDALTGPTATPASAPAATKGTGGRP